MPIQSDYDVISGAGGDVAMGLTKGLMYQREREDKQRIEQKDTDYKALLLGFNYAEKALSEEPEQASHIINSMKNSPAWKNVGLPNIPDITTLSQSDISQFSDLNAMIKGEKETPPSILKKFPQMLTLKMEYLKDVEKRKEAIAKESRDKATEFEKMKYEMQDFGDGQKISKTGDIYPVPTKESTPSWHIAVNPKSSTGHSWQDQNTGKMGGEATKPRADSEYNFGDKEIIRKTLTEIPKLKREAISAKTNITQIDKALDLVKTGVTGKGGQLKSFLAPYAEMVGIDTNSLNDAQKFQLLTRAIIMPMRLEIVGSGQVSDYEQKLMQQISGGGGAAKDAAKELLSHWKKISEDRINNYNDTLQGFKEIYPNVEKVYKIIPTKPSEQSKPSLVIN